MEYAKNREIEILRWSGIAATVVALVLLMVGCSGPSSASYPSRIMAGYRVSGLEAAGKVRQEGAAISRYLEQVHRQLHLVWAEDRLRNAPMGMRDGDPSAEIEVALDRSGQPGWVTVVRSSSSMAFDAAAIQAVMTLRQLPPLPTGLGAGHLFLRWRLSAVRGNCGARSGSLLVIRASKAEELGQALASADYPAAAAILRHGGKNRALMAEVVRAGLADATPARRARVLPLAYSTALEAICHQERGSELGLQALSELERRGETQAVSRLLAGLVSANERAPGGWTLALLKTAGRLKIQPAPYILDAVLASPRVAEVFAAAPLCQDAAQLDAVLDLWADRPTVAGPLWVRRCALAEDEKCLARVTEHLQGKERRSTLRGLRRYPLAGVREQVALLVRMEEDATVRQEAILALEAYGEAAPLTPLFTALRAEEAPGVVITAAQALGRLGRNPRGTSYRLAEVGYQVRRGPVAAAVLAAMARLGQEHFRQDVVRLQRHLSSANQAVVVRELWHFGEPVRHELSLVATVQERVLASAARDALARLDGEPAVKTTAPAPPPAPPSTVRTLDDVISLALSQSYTPGPSARR